MPIVRKRLSPAEVYPEDLRYNPDTEQVERLINGEWKPSPESDPRNQTTVPPRETSDPRCDAAKSVSDAFKSKIDETITAIDNGMTALEIAGLILGLFTFGVFAVLIELFLFFADGLLSLGSTAINDAMTEAAYDEFTCLLYCRMDNQGRIDNAGLFALMADVDSQIGGTAAFIFNQMLNLAGVGGVNNLGGLGTSTGDCDACDCGGTWCYIWQFASGVGDWECVPTIGACGNHVPGTGIQATDGLTTTIGYRGIGRVIDFSSTTLTKIKALFDYTKGSNDFGNGGAFGFSVNGSNVLFSNFNGMATNAALIKEWTGVVNNATQVGMTIYASRDGASPYNYSGAITWFYILFEGEGINPFGDDNCP